jgi:fructosamine-3-kinase
MMVQLGNGDGTFGDPLRIPMNRALSAITTGDWNGDGIADLAATTANNDVLGHGDGTFGNAVSYETGPVPIGPALGDFNGDGRPDIAFANSQPGAETVTVLFNDCVTRRRTARH